MTKCFRKDLDNKSQNSSQMLLVSHHPHNPAVLAGQRKDPKGRNGNETLISWTNSAPDVPLLMSTKSDKYESLCNTVCSTADESLTSRSSGE